MKISFVVSILLVVVHSEEQLRSAKLRIIKPIKQRELQTRPFTVNLDHFTPQDSRQIQFTYVQNLDHYRPNGALYFFINDNDFFTTELLQQGLMYDIATEAGAALITADNRFFRSNLPTANASISNLRYLTVEQTIYDIGILIQTVKADLNAQNSRVILWGTGMGAALATWSKQKLPHLIDGVWSSSGVYHRVVSTPEPFESLSRSIKDIGGAECAEGVRKAFATMLHIMKIEEFPTLTEALRMCSRPVYNEDQAAFFSGIFQIMTDYVNIHHFNGIVNFCADMASPVPSDTDPSRREFVAFTRWMRNIINKQICLDVAFFSRMYEASFVDWEDIQDLAWNQSLNIAYPFVSRPLFYLHCTQLGLFATNIDAESLFGNLTGRELYDNGCTKVFNLNKGDYDFEYLTEAVANLEHQFGGKNPGVSNVIYTNGRLDINFAFGISSTVNRQPDVYILNIPHYGRSADLFSVSPGDTRDLRMVKEDIRQLILKWSGVISKPYLHNL